MDSLPLPAAELIALFIPDERDLAALACTNKAWRDVLCPENAALWTALVQERFGRTAATDPPAALSPAQRWRSLASLKQPVARLDKIIWLDGNYLSKEHDAASTFGATIRVRHVCWLELGGRLHGVLPGRHRVAWRLRLEDNARLAQASLIARQEPTASGGEQQGGQQQHGAVSSSVVAWNSLAALSAQAGGGWFEVLGEPFDVPQPCTLHIGFESLSNVWKHGIVFDCVRLVRQPPPAAPAQQQQSGQQQGTGLLRWLFWRAAG